MRGRPFAGAPLQFAIVLALVSSGCSEEIGASSSDESADPIPTEEVVIAEEDVESPLRSHLYSERDVDVFARHVDSDVVEGAFVRAIHAEIGDRVREGTLLAALENRHAALQVEAARARLEEIQSRVERSRRLREKDLVPLAEHESYVYEMRVTEAELKQALLRLERTRVLAPFSGVVSRRYVTIGQRIDEETPLFRVTRTSPLRARFLVPAEEIERFVGDSTIALFATDGGEATGEIVLVGPTVDPASGTREVIVEVAGGGSLLPGSEVEARPEGLRPVDRAGSIRREP